MSLLTLKENEVQFKSFVLKESGLDVYGEPSFDEWIDCGNFIKRAKGAVHFWIGDWLNYGERKWGDKYKEAIQMTGFDYQTLRNDKWVTSQIPPERRQTSLSFDHHASVASLEEEEQDELLEKAVEDGISNKDFRKVVDGSDLSRSQDKQEEKKPEQVEPPHSQQEATIFIYSTTLLSYLNTADFDSMEESRRRETIKLLQKVKDKIVALEIKYD